MAVNLVLHVADLCAMASEETGHWLAQNGNHVIVLPEFAFIETFKGNIGLNIRDNFCILRHFPGQCLKMLPSFSLRGIGTEGQLHEVIDWDFTERLRSFLVSMNLSDDFMPASYVESNAHLARQRADHISRNVARNRQVLPRLEEEVRKCIGSRDKDGIAVLSRRGLNKIKLFSLDLAKGHLGKDGRDAGAMAIAEVANTFAFRHAASFAAIVVNRVANGSLSKMSDETLRNDVVDSDYMACSTYLHGFRTKDEQTAAAHKILTRQILT